VRALIADDPPGAQAAVTRLARTLRYTLTSSQEELVTLERELEIVEDYLALEALRFGDRLRIEREIDSDALGVRIPVMLLQTVVENAIKHGIAELPGGGVLRVQAAIHGDGLHISTCRIPGQRFRSDPATARGSDCIMPPSAAPVVRCAREFRAGPVPCRPGHRAHLLAEQDMKAMIVDDEPLARLELRRLLAEFPEIEIVGEAANVKKLPRVSKSGSRNCCSSTSRCRAAPGSICSHNSRTCRA
jgi:hypothetical protein